MTQVIKRFLLKFRSAEDIAANYNGYADFAIHATPLEKERLLTDVIGRANEMQKEVAASVGKTH